jgi:ribosomal 50S subunit-associated protein YjgA (DUF615 family)
MCATIPIPDSLAEEISAYLRAHQDLSLERLVERALRRELRQPEPEALRAMIDLVGRFPRPNRIPPEERQPEDRIDDYVF